MRIANRTEIRFLRNEANVRGNLAIKTLLAGTPGSPENYLNRAGLTWGEETGEVGTLHPITPHLIGL